jgi:chromosomal replication initiation ATPase DnaA
MRVAELKPRFTLSEPLPNARVIIRDVAQKHDIKIDEMLGKSRLRFVAWARQEAYDRVYRETLLSLPAIGRIFKKDHTTILHGIWAHRKRKAEGKLD